MMQTERLKYDYDQICKYLPKAVVRSVIDKAADTIPEGKVYLNYAIPRNSSDWLWRIFVKIMMPFQMKTDKSGKRKPSAIGSFYTILLILVSLMILYFGLAKYVLIPIWFFVIYKTIKPNICAFIKLQLNKSFYKKERIK